MSSNKGMGIILIVITALCLVWLGITTLVADYKLDKDIMYSWSLADKSSTLEAKAQHIDQFINNLDKARLSEYNAIFLKTPDNNVQNNIDALKTLKGRLDEIKTLDPESFAYQTAIQQITAQEQGEATNLLGVIKGGWYLANYPYLWGWIGTVIIAILGLIFMLGIMLVMNINIRF